MLPYGCVLWKMRYVEYDATPACLAKVGVAADCWTEACVAAKWKCATPKPRHVDEVHMSLLGPTIKAEVGDAIKVHFFNDPFPQCVPTTANTGVCKGSSRTDTTCKNSCQIAVIAQSGKLSANAGGATVADQSLLINSEYAKLPFSLHPHGVWYTKVRALGGRPTGRAGDERFRLMVSVRRGRVCARARCWSAAPVRLPKLAGPK